MYQKRKRALKEFCYICHKPVSQFFNIQSFSSGVGRRTSIIVMGIFKEYCGAPICATGFWYKSVRSNRNVEKAIKEIMQRYGVH